MFTSNYSHGIESVNTYIFVDLFTAISVPQVTQKIHLVELLQGCLIIAVMRFISNNQCLCSRLLLIEGPPWSKLVRRK